MGIIEFMQSRDLTKDEWMLHDKEELVDLLMNCHKILESLPITNVPYAIPSLPLPEITDEEIFNEANNYGKLVKENIGNNFQDYGVEENASLDFLRGAKWLRSRYEGRDVT